MHINCCVYWSSFVSLFIFFVFYFLAFWRPQRAPPARRLSITQSTDANVFSLSKTQHHFSWSGQVFGMRSRVEPSRSLSLPLSFFLSLSVCWFGADVCMQTRKLQSLSAPTPQHSTRRNNSWCQSSQTWTITITLRFQSLCNFSLIPPSYCHFFSMNASVRGDDVSPTVEAIFPYLRIWLMFSRFCEYYEISCILCCGFITMMLMIMFEMLATEIVWKGPRCKAAASSGQEGAAFAGHSPLQPSGCTTAINKNHPVNYLHFIKVQWNTYSYVNVEITCKVIQLSTWCEYLAFPFLLNKSFILFLYFYLII